MIVRLVQLTKCLWYVTVFDISSRQKKSIKMNIGMDNSMLEQWNSKWMRLMPTYWMCVVDFDIAGLTLISYCTKAAANTRVNWVLLIKLIPHFIQNFSRFQSFLLFYKIILNFNIVLIFFSTCKSIEYWSKWIQTIGSLKWSTCLKCLIVKQHSRWERLMDILEQCVGHLIKNFVNIF